MVVLLVIVLVLYEARSLMNTILLTFIFTYLIVHWVRLVQRWIPRVPVTLVVLLSYLLLILGLFYVVTDYVPMLVNQLVKMTNSLITFYQSADMHWLIKYLNQFVSSSTLATQARHGVTLAVTTLTNFGTLLVAVAMSVILSFFYTIELRQMNEFSKTFLSSQHLSWFFKDLDFFGKKFVNTFGVVLEGPVLYRLNQHRFDHDRPVLHEDAPNLCPRPHGLHLFPGAGGRGHHFLGAALDGRVFGRRDPLHRLLNHRNLGHPHD